MGRWWLRTMLPRIIERSCRRSTTRSWPESKMSVPGTSQRMRNIYSTWLTWSNHWRPDKKTGSTLWSSPKKSIKRDFSQLIRGSRRENCRDWKTCNSWGTHSKSWYTQLSNKLCPSSLRGPQLQGRLDLTHMLEVKEQWEPVIMVRL